MLAHSCLCILFPARGKVCSQQISFSSESTTFFRQNHGAKRVRNKIETAQRKYQSLGNICIEIWKTHAYCVVLLSGSRFVSGLPVTALDCVDFSLARQAQSTLLQEASPSQLWDFAFVLAEFDEIPLSPFLQPVQVPIIAK